MQKKIQHSYKWIALQKNKVIATSWSSGTLFKKITASKDRDDIRVLLVPRNESRVIMKFLD